MEQLLSLAHENWENCPQLGISQRNPKAWTTKTMRSWLLAVLMLEAVNI